MENHKIADKPRPINGDATSDTTHHSDETALAAYHAPPRYGQQPTPFGGYIYYNNIYYDNPWNEANDPNGECLRMAPINNNNGYGAPPPPPRFDRLRYMYENANVPVQYSGAVYSDYGANTQVAQDMNAPPPPPPHFEPPPFYGASDIPIKRRDLLGQSFTVNLDAPPSYDPHGQDIAVNDPGTLRFFYNLGHEYFGQLRARYGLGALEQLTHFNEHNDANNVRNFYPNAFNQPQQQHQQPPEVVDSVVYKTNTLKIAGKGVPNKIEPSSELRRQSGGGQSKGGQSKRYSTNRINVAHDTTGGESDAKVTTSPLQPPMNKTNNDGVMSPVDQTPNNSATAVHFDAAFHTPQRYTAAPEHPPPLLQTPVAMDGPYTTTNIMADMSPMAPAVPMPNGIHSYQQYFPVYPVDEQQVRFNFYSHAITGQL